jgi:hypothetical protein
MLSFFILFLLLEVDKVQYLPVPLKVSHEVSEEVLEFQLPIMISPSYFSSLGKIYAYISSPYIKGFKEIKIELSADNLLWKEIPIYTAPPNQNDEVEVGYIDLNKVNTVLYGRSYIPPQEIEKPNNVTKEQVLGSFKGNLIIKPIKTARDNILFIIIFITTFGVIYTILYSFISPTFSYQRKNNLNRDKVFIEPSSKTNMNKSNLVFGVCLIILANFLLFLIFKSWFRYILIFEVLIVFALIYNKKININKNPSFLKDIGAGIMGGLVILFYQDISNKIGWEPRRIAFYIVAVFVALILILMEYPFFQIKNSK